MQHLVLKVMKLQILAKRTDKLIIAVNPAPEAAERLMAIKPVQEPARRRENLNATAKLFTATAAAAVMMLRFTPVPQEPSLLLSNLLTAIDVTLSSAAMMKHVMRTAYLKR